MPRILLFMSIIFLHLAVPVQAGPTATRLSDKENVSVPQLAADAGSSRVILIGENHDDQSHHDLQLNLIRLLFAKTPQLAIGLEMIQTDSQAQLDNWSAGKLSEPAMQAVFKENWSLDWQMYRGIFLFARDNRLPMVGLNVPLAIVRKVYQHGFASLTPEEKRGLPEGTVCDLSNPQTALLRKAFQEIASHASAGQMFSNFCEAQTVRNSGMAINMVRYLESHPGRKIVGLTGIQHAVKFAIPDQLARLGSKLASTTILPETPELNGNNCTAREADYLVVL